MNQATLPAFLALAIAVGCNFHQTPYVTYQGNVPLSETAVFAAIAEDSAPGTDTRIVSADNKATPSSQAGFPYWVRVRPGFHTFTVRFSSGFSASLRSASYSYLDVPVEAFEMKAKHVYLPVYREENGKAIISIKDLGENPNFGIRLGLSGTKQLVQF